MSHRVLRILLSSGPRGLPRDEVVSRCAAQGMDRAAVQDALDRLARVGVVTVSPSNDWVDLVPDDGRIAGLGYLICMRCGRSDPVLTAQGPQENQRVGERRDPRLANPQRMLFGYCTPCRRKVTWK